MICILWSIRWFKAGGLVVTDGVLRCVPTAKTKIDTTNKSDCMVDYANLLVVGEEKLVLLELVGRSLNEYIGVKVEHRKFGKFGIDRDRSLHISVDDNEDFNSFSGLLLE